MPRIEFQTSGRAVDFDDGSEVNLLRISIRHECGVPYRCASGNCGTDRVHIEAGQGHLSPVRRKEHDRLGDLIGQGWRLACQTYASGDVAVTWSPDQRPLDNERAASRLRDRWLSEPDTAGREEVG